MNMLIPWLLAWTIALAVVVGQSSSPNLNVAELGNPAAPGSFQPNLTRASKGRIVLSWLEPAGGLADKTMHAAGASYSLRFAVLDGSTWSHTSTVFTSKHFKTHPSVPPSVTFLSNDVAIAYWAQGRASSSHAKHVEDVCVSVSRDGGKAWTAPVIPHKDRSETEHSFPSLVSTGNDSAELIWLDGRMGKKQMLMRATVKADGSVSEEQILDDDVCTCCPTAIAQTSLGPIAAFRDHDVEDVRDISVVARRNGSWSVARSLCRDGWKISGCPVNGVDLAAEGELVAAAWFTAANDKPDVRLAFSDNAGETFGLPLTINDGRAVGRSSIALLGNHAAIVLWVEGMIDRDDAKSSTQLLVRRVSSQGTKDPSVVLTRSARGLGFPRIESSGARAVVAWTDKSKERSLVTALVTGNTVD